ncbi:putative Mau operon transcriptional activator [uncultured Pleomorphomonas sp.]|uniref:Putative Mau operon transcriptional activator n=2 Tax=uncultured Pleomorphomonas sp. TaxID=442121 RepID=A0A212L4P0_9HYPH|nr:putative Mau operon transcriptional activator [uncultured Pleomorphomonas sp.]
MRGIICMNADMRWDELELVSEIVAGGTLSEAARRLGVDQTTAARRLGRIEARLGAALFDRIDRRLRPTPLLRAILPQLSAMAAVAEEAGGRLRRSRQEAAGSVRVSSLGLVHRLVLAPALGELAAVHPDIEVELAIEDRSVSFEERQADLAVRLGRGPEDAATIRRLGHLPFALYRPKDGAHSGGVVAYGQDYAELPEAIALQALRPDARVVARSNRLDVLAETAVSTGAAVMLPTLMGDADHRFSEVAGTRGAAVRDVYRLAHPERGKAPAVRAVARWIDATVSRRLGQG